MPTKRAIKYLTTSLKTFCEKYFRSEVTARLTKKQLQISLVQIPSKRTRGWTKLAINSTKTQKSWPPEINIETEMKK